MDFQPSAKAEELSGLMWDFLNERVLPAEAEYDAYRASVGPDDWTLPPVVEELKVEARAKGLWNLFLPDVSGLTNVEYAQLAEISGWSVDIFPEAINCQAPDTGNMETLHLFGTAEQKEQWLEPLLDGTIRSGLRDDRAVRRQQRRHQHRVLDHARRRRVRHQRHQVVDVRRDGPALPDPDRHGQDRPRRPGPPPAVDGARAHRHPRSPHHPVPDRVRPPRPARPRVDRVRGRAGARDQHPRDRGRRVHDRAGPPRPGPHPPLHALHRPGRARTADDGRARQQPRRVRRAARRPGLDPGVGRGVAHRDRAGPPADDEGSVDDRQGAAPSPPRPRSRPSRSSPRESPAT